MIVQDAGHSLRHRCCMNADARRPPAIPRSTHSSTALVFDRRHANRRAVFALHHELSLALDGSFRLFRHWHGVTAELVCQESVHWDTCHGLLAMTSHSPSLGETLSARRSDSLSNKALVLETHRVSTHGAQPVHRRLEVRRRAFTLASAPLEIASAWPDLMQGKRIRRQYLVLKVQRHAAVDFSLHSSDSGHVEIALTPVSLPLRVLFGRTIYRFIRDSVALESIDGLLDPRDRKRNGRWHEYLGRIEFASPVELARVAQIPQSMERIE